MRRVVALLVAAGAIAFSALAEEGPGGPGKSQERMERPRDEAFRMVDAYVLSNLQESLALSDEQFLKMLPLVKRLQNDRREFAQRRFRTLQALRESLESGAATESNVTELLRTLKSVEGAEPAAVKKDLDAVDAVLTPLQQAKYRVFEAQVEQKIRELMTRIRSNRPRPRGMMPRRGEGGP